MAAMRCTSIHLVMVSAAANLLILVAVLPLVVRGLLYRKTEKPLSGSIGNQTEGGAEWSSDFVPSTTR